MTVKSKSENRSYLAGIVIASGMLRSGLIDENDYSAIETEFAAKFLPLIRYEKPCLFGTLPVRQ